VSDISEDEDYQNSWLQHKQVQNEDRITKQALQYRPLGQPKKQAVKSNPA